MAMTVLFHKESLCPWLMVQIVLDSLMKIHINIVVFDALACFKRKYRDNAACNEVIFDMKTRQGINGRKSCRCI